MTQGNDDVDDDHDDKMDDDHNGANDIKPM